MQYPRVNKQQRHHTCLRIFLLTLALATLPIRPIQAASAPPASFADLAEKLSPSVVNISTTQVVKGQRSPHDFFFNEREMPEMFRRFFEHPSLPKKQNGLPPKEMKRTSLGSGVIISKDGYIVTNNHVVENAESINVRLTNFEEYEAKVIGRDKKSDLALLKINAKNGLPAVSFGNSDTLRVGDWVMAIGNPFGLEQTVTAGIVSGKGRSLGNGPYENFIQTDASINPGNSGGPLFNLNGEMVGINTAIYSRSGGNIGIGFAIPANMARGIIDQLKKSGKVVRGWLGVMIQPVTPELASQFKLDRPIGALVGEVSAGSPAAKAGIKEGDVIVEFNGKEVSQMNTLPNLVAQTPVGSRAEVGLYRKGVRQRLSVLIAKLDEEATDEGGASEGGNKQLGLSLQNLTPELASALGLKEKSGVLVTDVEEGSPAGQAGIRKGDLILELNQEPVKDVQTFLAKLATLKGKTSLSLFIRRDGRTRFFGLRLR